MRSETLNHYIRLCDYLVSTLARHDGPPDDYREKLAPELRVSADRIGRFLGHLKNRDGRVKDITLINPYETRFSHQFYVGLKLDFYRMMEAAPNGQRGAEWFIEKLIEDAQEKEDIRQHLVIVEGVTLHGPTDRDIELTVFTSDGINGVYRWIRDELAPSYQFIKDITTASVSYSHRWRGYAGQAVNPFNVGDDE